MAEHKWLLIFLVHTEIHHKSSNNAADYIDTTNSRFYKQVLTALKFSNPGDDLEVVVINTIINRTKEAAKYTTYVNHLKNNWFSLVDLHLPENFELQNKDHLTFLFNAIKNKYIHDKVIIFTFGHGSAFGIFSYLPENGIFSHFYRLAGRNISLNPAASAYNELPNTLDFLNNKFNYHGVNEFPSEGEYYKISGENNLFKIINQDVKPSTVEFNTTGQDNAEQPLLNFPVGNALPETIRITSNEDLAFAISESFGKVDFIIFNNCVMQNVYSQYAFKDTTDFLVAPQTGITKPGFNLRNFIAVIKNNKNADNKVIAERIVEDFQNQQDLSPADISLLQLYAIIAIKLGDKYQRYINSLFEIKQALLNNLNTDEEFDEKIDDSLRLCYPYEFNTNTGKTMIDLLQFISTEKMQQILEFELIKNKIENYNREDSYAYIGKNIFNQNGAVYENQKTSGLCIYFPRNYNSINEILNPFYTSSNYSSAFDTALGWEEFIGKYLSRRTSE